MVQQHSLQKPSNEMLQKRVTGLGNIKVFLKVSVTQEAWMTAIVLQQFLEEFDHLMGSEDRHVVLLLDNAPSHIASAELTSCDVATNHHNTSHVQSMDEGIIKKLLSITFAKSMRKDPLIV